MFMFSQFSLRAFAIGILVGVVQSVTISIKSPLETRAVGFQLIPQQLLDLSTLESNCLQTLKQTVNCDADVSTLGQREYHGSLENVTLTDAVCVTSCKTALTTFRRRAAGACATTPELLPGMTILSYVDSIMTGWNETCLKDQASGKYCNNIIESWVEVDEIEDMPQNELCSYCYGSKLRLMQSSVYSAYDEDFAAMLKFVNNKCGVSSPTTPVNPPLQNNGTQPGTCFSSKTIVTKQGDSCDSIAIANSVSGASLYFINPNLPNCTSIDVGLQLCLPQTCTTHTVKEGETCVEVGVNAGTSWMELVNWNLMLDARCSNIWNSKVFWGHVICVTPPGGQFEDGGNGNSSNQPGNGQSGGEGGDGNGYSNTIIDPPKGEVGKGTTKNCGFYVQAQKELGCAEMIMNASKSTPMNLFLQVNPSLRTAATCDGDLKIGVWYCLSPVNGWDEQMPPKT